LFAHLADAFDKCRKIIKTRRGKVVKWFVVPRAPPTFTSDGSESEIDNHELSMEKVGATYAQHHDDNFLSMDLGNS
jgi:hypothetical protein